MCCIVQFRERKSHGDKLNVQVTWKMIGWDDTVIVNVRDLWEKKSLGNFTKEYNATLPVREVQMLRLRKNNSKILQL